MIMYGTFFASEFKKWMRDPMMSFMVVYPLFFGILGRYIFPAVAQTSGFATDLYADFILAFLVLMTPLVFGAVMGFSVLEDRDDNVLTSIRITPLTVHQFLSFRVTMVFLFSVMACIFVIWFSDVADLGTAHVLSISFLASLSAPLAGFVITALSRNKIEGFAVMKGLGTVAVLPVIGLIFSDARELFFAIAPTFWPAKLISTVVRGESGGYLNFTQYYALGLVYVVVLTVLSYQLFIRRSQS